MRFFVFFLSIACLLACTQAAHAGAWTQKTGEGQLILTGSYYSTDHYWDNQGHRQSQPAYSQYALNPYVEYGLWDGLTVGGNLELQRLHQDGSPGHTGQNNFGLGDSELFVRQRLWQENGFVLSVQPMVKLPSPESSTAQPRLGGSSPDAGLGLSGGYGFSAFGLNHFIDLDSQYRHRFGNPHDQVNLAGTIGIGLAPRWMLMPQAFLTFRTAAPANAGFTESSGDDYNLVKLQLSTVYTLTQTISLQAGGFTALSGKNTGDGSGALFALWEKILMRVPLGQILLQRRLIDETQLAQALAQQKRNGSRLGDILIGSGAIGYLPLYRAVAEHYQLSFIDLASQPPDDALLRLEDAGSYLRHRAIPWRTGNGSVSIAVCDPSAEVTAWIKDCFGNGTKLVITSPYDIRRAVESRFGTELEMASRLSLWQNMPQSSARRTLLSRHGLLLLLIALALAASAPLASMLAIVILCHAAYFATMLFKCLIFASGNHATRQRNWTKRLASLDEQQLPVYTVLVPMYREAAVLPGLLDAMQNLDYPASKLDIKLLLEEDDAQTLEAACMLKPRHQFEILRIPPGKPQTKPRACNYGLRFARGEFITVFDADDRPERLQLKKAVYMFRTLPPDVVCLQARLNYYNAGDNLLTRFFSLEYTILFQFLLYGLERLGIPIPLGGTSNHMALDRLKALGEWDPYNVTEDADLGVRLAARGFKTAMLDSYTMEEAPNRVMPWINQRSRWIKGYMQTWLVHMRRPAELYRTLGWKSFVGFQFFVGLSSFTFLTAPLMWGLSLFWAGQFTGSHPMAFPPWLLWLATFNLSINLFAQWYFALHCTLLYRKQVLPVTLAALLYPLYLLLHSLASYKALWQLVVKPHFWEKTTHGLTRQNDAITAENDLLDMAQEAYSAPARPRMNSIDNPPEFALKERLI